MTIGQSPNLAYPTIADRAASGKQARKLCPRDSHCEWKPSQRKLDPLTLLAEQATTRVSELVPIRYGRMAATPFSYFRGAALPMAADLATFSRTGIDVQLCGDAHLSNFGGFASPERDLVFDVNDFDETHPGPFEWDVKRFAASLEIAGRSREFDAATNRRIVLQGVRTYRETVRWFSQQHQLDIWYATLDEAGVLALWGNDIGKAALTALAKAVTRASSKDHLKARSKLTRVVNGQLEFLSFPPLLVPIEDLFSDPQEADMLEDTISSALETYRLTLSSDRRALLNTFHYVATARKVVGVGSVGMRCWLALFIGGDINDPLILQIKQAEESVLERFTTQSTIPNHGQRVVEGQRIMQAASDIFLGWQRIVAPGGVARDFYVRQLWDWKASAEVDTMSPTLLGVYASMCGWTLARAHARSGDAVALASYLGSGQAFDRAIADFAVAYAEQNQVDYGAMLNAISDGRVVAESGV